MNPPKKILVIRNDKLGDFMLAWPAFSLLKQQYPNTEITALVPEYTALMAGQCPWIDKVLIDTREASFFKNINKLTRQIRPQHYDMAICFYLETRTALALWLAGVKLRVGPATRLAQIYLNRTLTQRRSRSIKPEFEYNIDLARYAIKLLHDKPVELQQPPFLTFDKKDTDAVKDRLFKDYSLADDVKFVIIHPGSGGSAINLSVEQYAELALAITQNHGVYIIITAGPGEQASAEALSERLKNCKHHIHYSTNGIIDFCKLISLCYVFISGSTGPLHIAGALNVRTAAFYPARRSATSLRWQTLNSADRRLAFYPKKYTGPDDMKQIDVLESAKEIIARFIL
ncbi:MAG: glycosyltransferase family 9 protein [Gammaproteobacteria bacterium]|nr:glycosyltransferase family 9 protein [Gammaproteobacteria bacterium]